MAPSTVVPSKNRVHGSAFYVRTVLRKVWSHPNNRHRRLRACAKAVAWQVYKRTVRAPIIVHAYDGMRIKCFSDSTAASDLIYFGELYEYDEMLFCQVFLRGGDTVIDGGANIGTFTLFMASLVRPGGRVIAVEPDRIACARLRENVSTNGLDADVDVVEMALAQEEGTAFFSTGWDVANRLMPKRVRAASVKVATTTLDRIAGALDEITFAKLDLEGGEHHALLGAEDILRKRSVVVWMIEATEWLVRRARGSRSEMLDLLANSGYRFATYEPRKGLRPLEADQLTMPNFFAIREDRWAMVEGRLSESSQLVSS